MRMNTQGIAARLSQHVARIPAESPSNPARHRKYSSTTLTPVAPSCPLPLAPCPHTLRPGVLNCNYFALGQNCRACSDLCTDENNDGIWLDQDNFECKPCSEV